MRFFLLLLLNSLLFPEPVVYDDCLDIIIGSF